MPGIIEPHSHMYGAAVQHLDRLGFNYPPDGVSFFSAQAHPTDLELTQGILRDALQDAVKEVDPGDWIVLRMQRHPEDNMSNLTLWGMTRRLTNRRTLDQWSPDNPVLMQPGIRGNINSKALEILDEFFPGYSDSIHETVRLQREWDIWGSKLRDSGNRC